MRGIETLYVNMFHRAGDTNAGKKGQRNTQTDRRDSVLAYRFYYWAQVRRKRYDDSLAELEREFFLTSAVVVQRLDQKKDLIKELAANKPGLQELRKILPYFNWQSDK